jgi:hypothetical protein
VTHTRRCDEATRAGRLAKARQFLDAATLLADLADEPDVRDAYITLCVHAGIAAADVVCCRRLGVHAHGENHHEAIALLGRADRKLAGQLEVLLRMKTASGYSALPSTEAKRKQAGRAARALVDAATTA